MPAPRIGPNFASNSCLMVGCNLTLGLMSYVSPCLWKYLFRPSVAFFLMNVSMEVCLLVTYGMFFVRVNVSKSCHSSPSVATPPCPKQEFWPILSFKAHHSSSSVDLKGLHWQVFIEQIIVLAPPRHKERQQGNGKKKVLKNIEKV